MEIKVKEYEFYYELRLLPFVQAIYLYGSRARQSNQPGADIDIAINCPRATQEDWETVQAIVKGADTALGIDCTRYDTIKDARFKEKVDKDKKLLFERKENISYQWYESFLDLGEALYQLDQMVKEPGSNAFYVRDATIQRFEFCTELFWKVLKKICQEEKFEVTSPRSVIQASFILKLIKDEQLWLKMLDDRNETSYMYKFPAAKEVYAKIGSYYSAMQRTYDALKERYEL